MSAWLRPAACVTAAILCSVAFAEDAKPSTITLSNGDTLKAYVVEESDAALTIDHPVLGRLTLVREQVTSIQAPGGPPSAAGAAVGTGSAANEPAPAPQAVAERPTSVIAALRAPDDRPFWSGWSGTVELGINASTGNTDRFTGRGSVGATRKTTKMETAAGLTYSYARDSNGLTENRGEATVRNDWLLGESPWRLYGTGKAEYDDLQEWSVRLSGTAGVGYQFIRRDDTTLVGRVGLGGSREFGGENKIVPEGNLGLDFSHKLTERQSITANFDYFPDLSEASEFRTSSRIGYQVEVDPETKLFLKVGLEHRYESDPGPAEHSDLDLFATLGLSF